MTHDHRVVQDMIDAGVLDAKAARDHPRAAVITRAIGAQPSVQLSVRHDRPQAGDVYLLCSDGVTDLVECPEIGRLLDLPHVQAADALLDAAMAADGRDNILLITVALEALDRGRLSPDSADPLRETAHDW